MESQISVANKVLEMRAAFDGVFARPPAADRPLIDNFLLARLGPDSCAIRLADVSALLADRNIVRIESPIPEFLGFAGYRGDVLPVYRLSSLLGHAGSGTGRWLVLTRSPEPVGLLLDEYRGLLQVPRADVVPGAPDSSRPWVSEAVRTEAGILPVVHVASVLEAIKQTISRASQSKI